MNRKKPLYRKVNTRTHGVRHGNRGEARWDRHTKAGKADKARNSSMHSKHRHGLDYTPLFRFLLSRVGRVWEEVYQEAVSRLDRPEPIFWMVAANDMDQEAVVRLGENSYFSGLFVNAEGELAIVAPELTVDEMEPSCACCTHTFNGEQFGRPFSGVAED